MLLPIPCTDTDISNNYQMHWIGRQIYFLLCLFQKMIINEIKININNHHFPCQQKASTLALSSHLTKWNFQLLRSQHFSQWYWSSLVVASRSACSQELTVKLNNQGNDICQNSKLTIFIVKNVAMRSEISYTVNHLRDLIGLMEPLSNCYFSPQWMWVQVSQFILPFLFKRVP